MNNRQISGDVSGEGGRMPRGRKQVINGAVEVRYHLVTAEHSWLPQQQLDEKDGPSGCGAGHKKCLIYTP
jgi:hypothetical protein